MKRLLDIVISTCGLIIMSPILLITLFLIWIQDFSNPFYTPYRVGKDGKIFKMYKLRSMIMNADKTGVDSTGANDARITKIGKVIRRFKLDEISQLINVFTGDMSLDGPRPNVRREVDIYTSKEREILTIKPGITDYSSIIFADEAEILKDQDDPDISYNQLIRPGKGALGYFYLNNHSLQVDLRLITYTIISIFNREVALKLVSRMLSMEGASKDLITLALRNEPLKPMPPLGSDTIVQDRT